MKLIVLLALVGACAAMPMTSFQSFNTHGEYTGSARCRDRNGDYYPLGRNFVRQRDGWICNCTLVVMRTRLACRSPGYGLGASYYQPGFVERVRSVAADHCVYEGEVYNLNTQWSMIINGDMMDCMCNSTAYMSCHMSRSTSSSGSVSVIRGDTADYKCQSATFRQGEYFAVRQPGGFYSMCSCTSQFTAACQVLTVSGLECQFPFEESGNTYSTCVSDTPLRAPHCVTSGFGVRPRTISSCITRIEDLTIHLGYIFTYGGNSNGARCQFPFTALGVQYDQCTNTGRRAQWCATTRDYDRDGRYGYCQTANNAEALFNRVGEPVTIDCRYDAIPSRSAPTITWYKLVGGGDRRQKIYTYDAATNTGLTASTAGIYAGRVRMPNARQLIIDNMRLEDAGTFECDVTYPDREDVYGRTDVSTVGDTSPQNLRYIYSPAINKVQFLWDNPTTDYDSIRAEYQEINGIGIAQIRMNKGRDNFVTYRMQPNTPYEIRIYTVTNGQDSPPARLRFTLPQIATTSTGRRPTGDSGENFPSAAQPLAQPTVSENNVYLSWYQTPIMDTQVTSWLIVYEDSATGESHNVSLSSNTDSYTLTNLKSGQRYRITIYAVVDENQIEIATADVITEHTPVELTASPVIEDSTSSTVTFGWRAPESADITQYEISYREADNPRASWMSYFIPASSNPRTTLRNLAPSTRYDVRIAPITNRRRGVYLPTSVSTSSAQPSGPLGRPRNLRFTDVTRSTFLASWEAPNDGNDVRRYRVVFHPTDDNANPIERTTSRTSFYAVGLLGGVQYTFRVSSLLYDDESIPVSDFITTADEVCYVSGRWRGADEEFYKRNARGYMQNCTCTRISSGGRWRCDPIICLSSEGISHTVDDAWDQAHASGDYIESCTCTVTGKFCRFKEAILQPEGQVVRQQLGSTLVLRCPHETAALERPTIRWFKLTTAGRVPLYTYYGPHRNGRAEVEAGHLNGRISMPNEVDFVINPVQSADSGTYECNVLYPGSITHNTHQTRINVVSRDQTVPDPIRNVEPILVLPSEPYADEVTSETITLNWDVPSEDVTSYIIEYNDIKDQENVQIVQVYDTSTAILRGLNPSTTYRVVIIPVIEGTRGEPTSVLISTNDRPETTLPPTTTTPAVVVPRPPTSLRFDSIGRTSVRAVWNIPYYFVRVDGYRVEYEPHGSDEEPVVNSVRNRYFRASNLEPGTAYQFRVYTLRDGVDSLPIASVVSTSPIGRILVQASNRRRSDAIGDDAMLACSYDIHTPGNPTVTWYKLHNDGEKTELATFNTTTGQLTEAEAAGDFAGRLVSNDQNVITIRNVTSSDDGSYQCVVTYATGGGKGNTRINVVGAPNAVVFTSPVISEDESEHTLSWTIDPAPRPDRFLLSVRRRGSTRTKYTVFHPPGGSRSFLFRNLRPGRTYEGNIIASNRYGASPPTEFYFTTGSSGQPDPPTALQLSDASPTQLTVHVVGPSTNTLYYRIRYAPESPIEGISEMVAASRNTADAIPLTGMVPNTAYVLRITGVNNNGESTPLTASLTTPPQLPEAPLDVVFDEILPRKVTLSITGPTDNVDNYEVTYQGVGGRQRSVRTLGKEQTVMLVLEPGTQYTVDVVAVNEYGRSTNLRAYVRTPQEESPPPRPTAFTAIRPRSDSVSVTWSGPTENVQYYVVEYQADDDTEPAIQRTSGPRQTVLISGLLPETQYRIAVKAVGQGGHSPLLQDYFQTEPAAPQPSDLTVVGSFPDEVTFEVEGIDDHVDYFIVRYYEIGNEDEGVSFTTTTPEITLSNLTPGTTYRVTVIAVRGPDRSEPVVKDVVTSGQIVRAAPSAPTAVRLVERGHDFVSFVINSPEELTNPSDFYRIVYRPTSREGEDEELIANGPSNEVRLSDLTPITRYQLTLYVVMDGLESEPFTAYFTTDSAELSIEPTNLRATSVSSAEATLEWDEPQDVRSVWRYIVEFRPYLRQDLPYTRIYAPSTTPYSTLSRLEPNTEYFVRVNSIGKRGRGIEAATTTFTTLRPTEPTPSTTEPIRTPVGFVVDRREATEAIVRWYPASNPDEIDGYHIEYEPTFNRQGGPQTMRVSSNESTATLTDLTPGTEYQVRMFALLGERQSEPARATFMSQLNPPSNLRAAPEDNRIIVTWDNPAGPRTGTGFAYRRGEGRWRETNLPADRTQYVIRTRPDIQEPIEISVKALGGTIVSDPVTITVYPRPDADEVITGAYVDEISDRQAQVIFEDTYTVAPEGWTLTLEDENGIIGSPVHISENARSHPLSNLRSAHRYTVTLTDTEGSPIGQYIFMTKAAQPENVRAPDVNHDAASVSWQSPEGDDITGYVVEYRPVGESDWTEIPVNEINNPSLTLDDLRPSTLYEIRISSTYVDTVRQEDERGIPTSIRFTTRPKPEPTPPPDIPPRPVSNLRFTSVTENSFRAQWEPSSDLDIDMYRAVLRHADDFSIVVSSNVRNSYAVFTGLRPNTAYTLSVFAVRNSELSEPTTGSVNTVIEQPLQVSVDNVDDSSFRVIWQPATPAERDLTDYVVTVQRTDTTDAPVTQTVNPDVTRYPINDLYPGTTYDVSVTPIVDGIEGSPVMTRATTQLPSPDNVYIDQITDNSFVVVWDQPNEEITEYYVEYRRSDSVDNFRERVQFDTEVTLDNLLPETEYVVTVYSIYNNRRSPATVANATTEPQIVIPTPQDVEVFDVQSPAYGSSRMSVRWRPDPAHAHLVIVTPENGRRPAYEERINDADRVVVDNLNPSTVYRVDVYAVDTASDRPSSPVSVTQKTKPRSPPTLYVQERNQSSVLFTWPDVEIDGVAVTGYRVTYRPDGGDVVEVDVREPTLSLTGLPPMTTIRDITVQTIVGDAFSDPYAYPGTVTTASLPAPYEVNILPEPEIGPDAYIVTWVPVRGYSGTYEVSYHPSDATQTRTVTSHPRATSQRLPALLPGVRYVFNVVPSQSQTPESTTSVTYTTEVPAPTTISVSDVTDDGAVVEFTAPDYDSTTLYEVRYYPANSPSSVIRRRIRPDRRKALILGDLEPGTEYVAQVLAHAGLGASPPRSTSFTTREPAPTNAPAPTAQTPEQEPSPLDSNLITEGSYRVTWQEYSVPVQYYKVIYRKHSGGKPVELVIPSYLSEAVIENLIPGENYDVNVVAVLPSREETDIGTILIDTGGESSTERTAIIDWVEQSSEFTHYRITATPQGNPLANIVTLTKPGNVTSVTLSDLYPGTRYIVLVEGYSGGNVSPIVETTITTAVDPPTNLTALRIQTTSINLGWTKPRAPIDGYSLTYQLNGRGPETTYIPSPHSNAQKITMRTLTPGQRYVIRLYARSTESDSYPAQLWTETAVPSPQRFQTRQATPNLLGLKWGAPVDSLTHYTLRVVGPNNRVVVDNLRIRPDQKSYIVRDLQPNTRYHLYLTAWIGDLHSQPAYRSSLTPREISGVTSKKGQATDDGFLVTWKGRSRSVEGWLIVVESNDGTHRYETRVDRLTKRYELENLRAGLAYTVTIYPFSGSIRGTPSVITIPASEAPKLSRTLWRMQIPQVESDSVTLIWHSPWLDTPVTGYQLFYKRLVEEDSEYRLAPSQPGPDDLTATINNLEPGESYSIKLVAYHSGRGDESLTVQILANFTTPLPPPTAVHMERREDGSTVFSWQASSVSVSGYVVKYRIYDSTNEQDFTILQLSGDTTTVTLPSLESGQIYEVRLYAVKGRFQSNVIVLRIDIPSASSDECEDPETRRVYQIGEHWISETDGYRLNCSCNGPQRYDCDTGEWCHTDGQIYNPGDTWRKEYDNNKKELCICEGRAGYKCYPRNCLEDGRWYDEGTVWTSTMDGQLCSCSCPADRNGCSFRCHPSDERA